MNLSRAGADGDRLEARNSCGHFHKCSLSRSCVFPPIVWSLLGTKKRSSIHHNHINRIPENRYLNSD